MSLLEWQRIVEAISEAERDLLQLALDERYYEVPARRHSRGSRPGLAWPRVPRPSGSGPSNASSCRSS
ncbi:hypothetical protein VB773_18695 [Haloarculaceae archaeon H-GB2-1]|nr:hypothetical protein [Haloarculaceae archaeon H-GB11]MEA5409399.1 hypothetical protein [Haloarculaceae archaeon H-GB2-1]